MRAEQPSRGWGREFDPGSAQHTPACDDFDVCEPSLVIRHEVGSTGGADTPEFRIYIEETSGSGGGEFFNYERNADMTLFHIGAESGDGNIGNTNASTAVIADVIDEAGTGGGATGGNTFNGSSVDTVDLDEDSSGISIAIVDESTIPVP